MNVGPTETAAGGRHAVPGALLLDLVAAVLQAGAPPGAALDAVGRSLESTGDPRGRLLLAASSGLGAAAGRWAGEDGAAEPVEGAAGQDPTVAALVEGLELAVRAGIGPSAMVRRAAEQRRRRQAFAQQAAIRRLEIWLVAPAGLCWLPAFVLVGVVPLVIDLVRG